MSLLLFADAAKKANDVAEATAKAAHDSAPQYFQWLHDLLPAPFFHTQAFLAFFALVLLVYWSIPRRFQMTRIWVLVIASFHFYAAWSYELAFLVTGTTLADYLFGRLMGHSERPRFRKLILYTSIGMNLGILCYFKYRGFFLNELYDGMRQLGMQPGYTKINPLEVFIPFGISFYTFEAISYAVDVYKRKIVPEKSLPRFLLFILFFPHLVAGPIVRAGDFLTQTRRVKRWNWVRVQVGVQLFLVGAFKKMAIADRMALFCDPVFQSPEQFNSVAVWFAVLAYAVRIYCDFSGYSDMAVGAAHLLGYKLINNFNMPYLATNVSDFWRRWHISLSTWLRDYVFIPLGGSRGSRWLNYRNLLITMTVGGLWHGAAWGYILWGLAHGLMLVAHKQFKDYCEDKPRLTALLETTVGTGVRVLVTFFCVGMCWILFQPELSQALKIFDKLFHLQHGLALPLNNRSLWYTVAFLFACQWLVRSGVWAKIYPRLPAPVLGVGYALCLCTALVLAPDNGTTFIYFQFYRGTVNARLLTFGWLSRRPANRPRAGSARGSARRGAVIAVLCGVLVFGALQVALSSASAVTHLVADPFYGDKERRLRRLERAAPVGAPRVILLGTSRTGYGFAAGRVQAAAHEAGTPAVAFNFGVPGAGPVTHLIYLRRLLADGHRPDLLLVEVLPPLLADLPDGPFEARMLKGDFLTRAEVATAARYAMPAEKLRKQQREAALSPVHEHRFKLLGRLLPSALPWQLRYDWGRTPDPNGWNASDVEDVSDEQRAKGIASADAEYRAVLQHDLPAGPSVGALRDLLALCRTERISVALVLLPEATTFRALYPARAEPKLTRFLAELSAEFACPVTDARTWVPDHQFLDSHHLLRTGAAAFTDRLARELIVPFLLDPHRGAR